MIELAKVSLSLREDNIEIERVREREREREREVKLTGSHLQKYENYL